MVGLYYFALLLLLFIYQKKIPHVHVGARAVPCHTNDHIL